MKRILMMVVLTALVLGWAMGSLAAPNTSEVFKPKAQVWHRFEASNREFNANTAVSTFNLARTRLSLMVTPTPDMEAFIQLQDSRVWGEESSTIFDGSADRFDLHQGYIKIKDFFKAPLDVKLGRQIVNYGLQRLVGGVEWHFIGRTFDGVILDLHQDKWWLDGFAFQVVDSLYPGDYKDMFFWGTYGGLRLLENHKQEFFAMWQRKQPSSVLDRGTAGWFLEGNFGPIKYQSDAAYQFGNITPAGSQGNPVSTVEAWMFTLNLGYVPAGVSWKPGIFLGADVLSGDDDATDGKWKAFDTLYGTNHKFYGAMDYFINIPKNTYGGGLVDTWGRFKCTPLNKTTFLLDGHYFQSQQDVSLSDDAVSKKFGTEVDFTMMHKYTTNLTFILGASWFGPDAIFKDKKGVDSSTWFYVWTVFNI
jgi:hypothetical protein